MPPELEVRFISAAQTVPLRAEVLRPGRPLESAVFAGDENSANKHFGALQGGEIVGVASIFQSPLPATVQTPTDKPEEGRVDWQLRGMAVDPTLQKSGVGKALLTAISEFIAEQPNALLWCNARSSAVEFYKRNGFETRGEEFVIPDVGPHFVMVYSRTKN